MEPIICQSKMKQNLSWNNEMKIEISWNKRNKEAKVNITKYNQLARERYCEIQYWSERKVKHFIINKGKPIQKNSRGQSKNNVKTWWVYSKLRRRIKEDFRLRDSIN